jgi:RNA polymerase primary sigma factor
VGLTSRINRAYSQLEQEFEREPSAEELSEMLNIEIEEIAATLSISARHVSMDSPLSEGEEGTLVDVMQNPNAEDADDAINYHQSLHTEIDRSLNTLTQRQQEVIRYFFGIGVDHPMSLEDIGARFNLTRERVRQIKDKAINKLKTSAGSHMLKVYLG